MPLMTCPSCGREVLSGARACPGCGQWSGKNRSPIAVGLLVFVGLVAILVFVGRTGLTVMERIVERRATSPSRFRRLDSERWTRANRAAAAVRVTSNREAVSECKFLGAIRSTGRATRSAHDLQFEAAWLGGNVVFSAHLEAGREISGDAYSCADHR